MLSIPTMDDGSRVIPGRQQEVVFKNEERFERFMNRSELRALQDDDTGKEVMFFEELKDGGVYTAVLRPSSGVVSMVAGVNRSRVNAAEQEFRQALPVLVAEEEGVSLSDVQLVGGPLLPCVLRDCTASDTAYFLFAYR